MNMIISQNQEPLVGECISVGNSEKTMGRTVASILNKNYKISKLLLLTIAPRMCQ